MKKSLVDAVFPPHHCRLQHQVSASVMKCADVKFPHSVERLKLGGNVQIGFDSENNTLTVAHLCLSRSVTVFSEVAQSDTMEHASQSVPTVSTSTPGLVVPGTVSTAEDRDDVFLEPDTDRLDSLPFAVCQYYVFF